MGFFFFLKDIKPRMLFCRMPFSSYYFYALYAYMYLIFKRCIVLLCIDTAFICSPTIGHYIVSKVLQSQTVLYYASIFVRVCLCR